MILDWLAHRADAMPNALALIAERDAADAGERDEPRNDTGETTFAELNARVDVVAGGLWEAGVRAGDRVAMLAWNAPEVVELVFAVSRLGAALVPLNARLKVEELAFQLRDADVRLLVCDAALGGTAASAAEAAGVPVPRQSPIAASSLDPTFERVESHGADDTLCIMYTSGTTGLPKGVEITYRNIFASAAASAFNVGVQANDRWLACLPLFHIGGLSIILRSVLYGTTAVVHRQFDEVALSLALRSQRITQVSVVATMLQRLLDFDARPCPGNVRLVLVGGGPCPEPLLERAASLGYPVVQTYGLTETASQVATLAPGDALRKLGSAGKALVTTRLRIDAAPGEAGEILVSGPVVTKGYFRRPEATEAAIVDGWLHTGDIGRLDGEGYLYVLDRRDDLIVSGGENVYPAEVEAALLRHPDVQAAAVVGLPDERWGQTVAAAIIAAERADPDEIRTWLRERLASFKVPVRIEFVDELPMTASGKVQRRLVREQLERRGSGT